MMQSVYHYPTMDQDQKRVVFILEQAGMLFKLGL